MKHDLQTEKHHRHSIRVRDFDYSQPGAYFITVCVNQRNLLLGDIQEGKMILNHFGMIVREEWLKTEEIRPSVKLDAYIIMPNHLHGIILLFDPTLCPGGCRGTLQRAPTLRERFGKPTSNSIPTIVRLFKSSVTKRINLNRGTPGQPVWQSNYYEHIVRNETEMNCIREYIHANPHRWTEDQYNPNSFIPQFEKGLSRWE